MVPQSNEEVEPDTDGQTMAQAATNPTVTVSVLSENQATALPGSFVTQSVRISRPQETGHVTCSLLNNADQLTKGTFDVHL